MKKLFNLFLLSGVILMSLINGTLHAQNPFPISLDANGGEVFVESMDIGPDGDYYITGSVKNFVNINFSPSCYDNVTFSEPTGGDRLFVARLHADPVDAALDDVVWMVIGTSTISNTGGIFSGKDIEVASDGSVFITGTLVGDVEIKRVIGGSPSPINSCLATSNFRHFAAKIDANGTPIWVSDTDGMVPSYGEGITLDEANNRIFTGGYIGNAFISPINFTDGSPLCTGSCGFTVTPTIGSPYVGFVTQYSLNGINRQAFQIGEKVMALTMDQMDPGNIWVTGSIFDSSSDVLFARIPVNIITPPCAIYPPMIVSIPGSDGDIGLDIAYTSDNHVAITGAFETNCFFSPVPPIFTPPGMSDLFVAVYDPIALNFTAATATSSLAPVSTTTQSYLQRNSCIAADPYSSSHIIIAYDKDMELDDFWDTGYIITKELTTGLLPPVGSSTTAIPIQIAACVCPPAAVSPAARVMEIEYGLMGSGGFSYLAGDYKAEMTVGPCMLNGTGSWNDGFVGRVAADHSMFLREQRPEQLTNEALFLYPNPSQGAITILYTVEEESDQNLFSLYNLKGQLVYEKQLSGYPGEHKAYLEMDLPNGTYFAKMMRNQAVYKTQKLVIFKE